MQITITRTIDAAPKRLFELLERPDRQKRWLKGLDEMTFLDPGGSGGQVGRRFRQHMRRGKGVAVYEGQITAYERPFLYGYIVGNDRFQVDVEYRIEALAANRSRVEYRARATETGFWNQFMGTLFRPLARGAAKDQLKRLAAYAESR